MKIELEKLVGAIEISDDEINHYYDIKNQEIIMLIDESIGGSDDQELSEEVLYNHENYIYIPGKYERHDYNIMRNFVNTISDDKTRDILEQAISGRGAFRNFKQLIYYFEVAEDWYQYRNDTYKEIAINWCDVNDIGYY